MKKMAVKPCSVMKKILTQSAERSSTLAPISKAFAVIAKAMNSWNFLESTSRRTCCLFFVSVELTFGMKKASVTEPNDAHFLSNRERGV